jgi:hypothetical protein
MSFGFIILRHVTTEQTNKLWTECYDCIRQFYPFNKILIIDDFSDYKYIDTNKPLSDTLIIQTEFKGRGELLPYYYYLQNKLFDYAVIIHDSVFIQKHIYFKRENQFIWSFEHHWDHLYHYTKLISKLKHQEIISSVLKNINLWKGCFGVMSVITHDFLCDMNNTFNIANLIESTVSREDRMCLERVFAVLFTICNQKNNIKTTSIFGDIHSHCNWGQDYETYQSKKKNNALTLPIEKVWSGR